MARSANRWRRSPRPRAERIVLPEDRDHLGVWCVGSDMGIPAFEERRGGIPGV
jgi:hypothetical protein